MSGVITRGGGEKVEAVARLVGVVCEGDCGTAGTTAGACDDERFGENKLASVLVRLGVDEGATTVPAAGMGGGEACRERSATEVVVVVVGEVDRVVVDEDDDAVLVLVALPEAAATTTDVEVVVAVDAFDRNAFSPCIKRLTRRVPTSRGLPQSATNFANALSAIHCTLVAASSRTCLK
jgi:hypothetical protein